MADNKLVLVVDDEVDAVDFVKSMLSDVEGVETASASDGDSALAKVDEINPDLIILDVQMPGKNGFEVFAELKKNDSTKNIPVIMLTGVEDKTGVQFSSEDMGDYLGSKPEAFIDKPVSPEKLQETVKSVLGL